LLEQINHAPHSVAVGLAWRLARELHCSDAAASLAIEGLVLEVLADAVRSHRLEGASTPLPGWLAKAQEYIHAQFRLSFRIADVAREVNVSPVRLARRFRRHFGLSLASYTRKLRLDWAGVELASSEQPLSVIARRAGFADQSHFTRAFRQHTGLTPHRYRVAARH
jgi:AraC-like DNA-binding protein